MEVGEQRAQIQQEPVQGTAVSAEAISLFQQGFYALQWSIAEGLNEPAFESSFIGFFWQRALASHCLPLEEGLDIHDARQSFHATVERLQSCPGLEDAHRSTWAEDSSSASSS